MWKKIVLLIALIISVYFIRPEYSFGQGAIDPRAAKVDDLFQKWDKMDSPGAAVAVIKDGKIILQREYGMANLEYDIPITSSTVFHIGSVSKQFTAFAVLLLEEQGKISLDDDIHSYLSEVPDFGKKITIRHLIHHLSGLREQEILFQLCGISNADVIETEHILKIVRCQNELNFNPGDEIEYCNTGYTLLAEIVERVTGESFREWTAENIFKPLGMNNSQFYDDHTRIVKNRAYPYYIPAVNELRKGILNYSYVGPTSVFTTSEDMVKWLMNLDNPKIGFKKIVNRMLFESGRLNNGEKTTYGFGIGVTEYKGLKVNLHSGHDAGYRAFDAYFPEQKFGIVILSNFYSINPSQLGYNIADIYLADHFTAIEQDEAANSRRSDIDRSREISLTKKQLMEYSGRFYSDELETHYLILAMDGKLVVKHWRNEDVLLTAADDDSFTGDKWWFKDVKFIRDNKQNIVGFNLTSGRVREIKFVRIPFAGSSFRYF